jgi:hypothetical protein
MNGTLCVVALALRKPERQRGVTAPTAIHCN